MAATASITPITSIDDFSAWLLTSPAALHVVWAYAEWHEPCKSGGAIDVMFLKLAEAFPAASFAKVNAEEVVELAESLDISVVPTFFLYKNKVLVDKIEGANVSDVTIRVERWSSALSTPALSTALPTPLSELNKRLEQLINASPIMLFMKGCPETPKCKYSRKAVDILQAAGVSFGSFDILSNQAIRQGLKDYGNWPTYPQLWVNGKLTGGVDIMEELRDSGELSTILPSTHAVTQVTVAPIAPSVAPPSKKHAAPMEMTSLTPELEARLKALVSRSSVVLFMKGTAESPSCGFSDRMVKLLKDNGLDKFDNFDILTDPEVRAGLKLLSNWPTFPQLYVHGKLVGGLDILQEMINESPDETLAQQLGITA